ncbi:hypothetical protein ACHAXT_004256 [Thalassiosira profunda]
MAGEDSCKTHLPDGRVVELCSRDGADTFLTATQRPSCDWFTINMGICGEMRRRARAAGARLTAGEKQHLLSTGFSADCLARYSTPSLFASVVPDREFQFWMDQTMIELRFLGHDPRWRRTGALEQHDAFIIHPCVSMFVHDVPAQLAMEKDLFKALGDFVGGLNPSLLPSTDIAETLCLITGNAFMSLFFRENNPWPAEKIFKKLESSGWLAQYIKITSVPQDPRTTESSRGILKIYDEMLNCPAFMKRKLRRGEPCGDVVHDILSGTVGSRERTEVVHKLKAISNYAEILQPGGDFGPFKVCRKCSKAEIPAEVDGMLEMPQQSLLRCARCQTVYYCSKECQASDWKEHKKQCRKAGSSATKSNDACRQIVFNFSQKYYVAIMERVVTVCKELGLTKAEVLLELDFYPDDSGVAPALRYPPVFAVKESRGYFEGERPNEPDWFFKTVDAQTYERNVKATLEGLVDQHDRLTENHLLCFARHPGFMAAYRMQLVGNNTQLFGEDAFNAFRIAIHDEDIGPLTDLFGETAAKMFSRSLATSPYSRLPNSSQNLGVADSVRDECAQYLQAVQRAERVRRNARLTSFGIVATLGAVLSAVVGYFLK